jgi:dynactin complex subunit
MVVRTEEYLDFLCEEYPDINRTSLNKIIKKGLSEMQSFINSDHDIRIGNRSDRRVYHMTIIRPMKNFVDILKRSISNKKRLIKYRENRKSNR